MPVARVYNPNTQQWEVVAQGAKGEPGDSTWDMITGKPDLTLKADLVGGLVPTSQLPAVALTKPFVVSNRTAMLALTAQEGDVAVITTGADKGTYMLGTGAPTSFSSWVALVAPTDAVTSVNGQTGVVNLTAANVGAAATSHSHTMSQVTDLPALETPTLETIDRANKIAVRDSKGRLLSQNYYSVQGVFDTEQELPHTLASLWAARQVATDVASKRPALFSGTGAPPASIPGAVVGDWWLNTSTMELHRITGV